MNTEVKALVDQVARILNIHVGHFDHYKFGDHYPDLKGTTPLLIAYPGRYSNYVFMITDQLEIHWDMKSIGMFALEIKEMLQELEGTTEPIDLEFLGPYKNYKEAEKWLKENEEMVRRVLTTYDSKVLTYKY